MFSLDLGNLLVHIKPDSTEWDTTIRQMETSLENSAQRVARIGTKMSLAVTAPLVLIGRKAMQSSLSMETAFAGTMRTVNATTEQYAELRMELDKLSRVIPLPVEEFYKIAASAGQLGIQRENIAGFTKVMADLGATTNMTSDQAATALARLANIMQMPQDQFDRLGSTLFALGMSSAATESEISDMAVRIAGVGKIVGLTEAKVLALSAALASVGMEPEAGGTAVSKIFLDMYNAANKGGSQLKLFAAVAGQTAEDFAKAFKQDAASAMVSFIEGLGAIHKAGGNVSTVLESLGQDNVRVIRALLSAAGAGDLFRQSLELGNKAWEENIALVEGANKRYQTHAASFQRLVNRIRLGVQSIGGVIAEQVLYLGDKFVAPLIDGFQSLDKATQDTMVSLGLTVAAVGPLTLALAGLLKTLKFIVAAFGSWKVLLATAGIGFVLSRAVKSALDEPGTAAALSRIGTSFSDTFNGIRRGWDGVVEGYKKGLREIEMQTLPKHITGELIQPGTNAFAEEARRWKEAQEASNKQAEQLLKLQQKPPTIGGLTHVQMLRDRMMTESIPPALTAKPPEKSLPILDPVVLKNTQDKAQEIMQKLYAGIDRDSAQYFEAEQQRINQETQTWQEYAEAIVDGLKAAGVQGEWTTEKVQKMVEGYENFQTEILKQQNLHMLDPLYENLNAHDERFFEHRQELLDNDVKLWTSHAQDIANRLKIEESAVLDLIDAYREEQQVLLQIEQLKSSDNLAKGFQAAGLQIKREMQTWGEKAYDVGMTIQSSLEEGLMSVWDDWKNWKDAVIGMLKEIAREIMRTMVVKPLTQQLTNYSFWGDLWKGFLNIRGGGGGDYSGSGNITTPGGGGGFTYPGGEIVPSVRGNVFRESQVVPFAKGGVLSIGRETEPALTTYISQTTAPFRAQVVPFAKGGVIGPLITPSVQAPVMSFPQAIPFASGGNIFNRPTYFPMAGGKTGKLGEAGEEAILPLNRDRSGRLGVIASNSGGGELLDVTKELLRESKKQKILPIVIDRREDVISISRRAALRRYGSMTNR